MDLSAGHESPLRCRPLPDRLAPELGMGFWKDLQRTVASHGNVGQVIFELLEQNPNIKVTIN